MESEGEWEESVEEVETRDVQIQTSAFKFDDLTNSQRIGRTHRRMESSDSGMRAPSPIEISMTNSMIHEAEGPGSPTFDSRQGSDAFVPIEQEALKPGRASNDQTQSSLQPRDPAFLRFSPQAALPPREVFNSYERRVSPPLFRAPHYPLASSTTPEPQRLASRPQEPQPTTFQPRDLQTSRFSFEQLLSDPRHIPVDYGSQNSAALISNFLAAQGLVARVTSNASGVSRGRTYEESLQSRL